jgi:hypothetical protein
MDESILVERGMEKSEVFNDGGWEAKLLRSDIGKDVKKVRRGVGDWGQISRVDKGRRGDVARGRGIN